MFKPKGQQHSVKQSKHKTGTEAGGPLMEEPDILKVFAEDLELMGVVGESQTGRLLYLILTSRVLKHPVSAVLKAPSSAGKSYLLESVMKFFPKSAYFSLTAMTERALVYYPGSLQHRMVILFEAHGLQGQMASYFVRSLLSEGKISYATTERKNGKWTTRHIEKKGPTGLVMTTTAHHLHHENETRVISIPVSDTAKQTARIMHAIAAQQDPADGDQTQSDRLERWCAFQSDLEDGPLAVVIPYAEDLSDLISPVAVRLRRDISVVLGLVRTHAIIHRKTRKRDVKGRIIAKYRDYAAVHDLVADLLAQGVGVSVSKAIRETVSAVEELAQGGEASGIEVAKKLHLDKSAASRRIQAAIKAGYVRNLEEHKGRPMRLALGEPLPDEKHLLPTVEQLRGCRLAKVSEINARHSGSRR